MRFCESRLSYWNMQPIIASIITLCQFTKISSRINNSTNLNWVFKIWFCKKIIYTYMVKVHPLIDASLIRLIGGMNFLSKASTLQTCWFSHNVFILPCKKCTLDRKFQLWIKELEVGSYKIHMWSIKLHPLFDVSLFIEKNAWVGAYARCVCCPWKEECSTCFYLKNHDLDFFSALELFFTILNNLVWWKMWLKYCMEGFMNLDVESYKIALV
jgi:hypothetical protein